MTTIDVAKELIQLHQWIAKLDEAMASEERIAMDTRAVGGFVSNLDITETAEQIIQRAIKALDKCRNCNYK